MHKPVKKEIILYVVVGVLLITAISMLMTVRVQSRTREKILFDNSRYEAAETIYKDQVQDVLEAYGCCHSGLTMTRVVSLEGEREYQIQIYNTELQSMAAEDFAMLEEKINACHVAVSGAETYDVEVVFIK